MRRYITSTRGQELSGRVRAHALPGLNVVSRARRICGARNIRVGAKYVWLARLYRLNARGLQNKLLITPFSE